jgi:hypothetical protein
MGREVKEMLSIEIIAVLAAVYGLLVYRMVKSRLATRQAEAGQQAEGAPAAAEQAG